MLILRAPSPLDLPPLYNLAEDTSSKFLDDYHSFDLEYAHGILIDSNTLVIDDNGFAVGVFWFDEVRADLHAQFHLLARPEYWRRILKEDICGQAVSLAFEKVGVSKFMAQTLSTQKSAIKLLRRYGFFEHRPWYKHTRQGGIKVDVINFELRRKHWEKQRGKR
jgi:RimJ/RimL family protein N-acetyltransferase